MTKHVWYRCGPQCDGCMYCEGGLGFCTVCRGGEGSLPTECPGEAMPMLVADEVYAGRLDFKDGKWVHRRKKNVN